MLSTSTARALSALRASFVAVALTAASEASAQRALASADSSASIRIASASGRAADRSAPAAYGATRARYLWEGQVRGDVAGPANMTLERVGPPEDALDPVWPVLTRFAVRSMERNRSFVAELYGTVEGFNNCMHLRGIILEGWKKGAEVHVDCRSNRGSSAVVRIFPRRTSR